MSVADSKKVVMAALAGNLAIALCKFGAAFLSHSSATLAEAVHSLADTGNQGLLLVGMWLAKRPADERFPFGRSSERYFWPFVVALLLFSVGGAFAIFDGVHNLLNPSHEAHSRIWSYGVLGVSLVFEAFSFKVAFAEFKVLAKGLPWKRAILEARDPTVPLVLMEDTAAIAGLALAFTAVGLSDLTGYEIFDPIGSIIIGVLLCGVAILLAKITHGLLIGESATPEDQARALVLTEEVAGVERVTQLLTLHLGPDVVILALKVAFRPGMTVRELEEATDAIEAKIRAELPQMRKIFVELDSDGDGRGLASARSARVVAPNVSQA
jgi:cation diffusion facilitator family transporter